MLVKSKARLLYLSIPPRKMRLVAGMVKGLPVEKALNILNFTPKIAARHLAKTVKSAAANALSSEGTDNLHPEDLVIENICVDNAPTAKRVSFRSMGRVFRIRKRFCHVTVNVTGETVDEAPKKATKGRTKKAEKETAEVKTTKKKTTAKKAPAKKKAAPKKTAAKATAKSKATKKEDKGDKS